MVLDSQHSVDSSADQTETRTAIEYKKNRQKE